MAYYKSAFSYIHILCRTRFCSTSEPSLSVSKRKAQSGDSFGLDSFVRVIIKHCRLVNTGYYQQLPATVDKVNVMRVFGYREQSVYVL